jgi:hypothetical protein
MSKHSWIIGEWEEYGEYVHRDDVCKCGCSRRIALNEEGKEWVDFYEWNNNYFFRAPDCNPYYSKLIIIVEPESKKIKKPRQYLNHQKEVPVIKSKIERPPSIYSNAGYLSLLDKYAPL